MCAYEIQRSSDYYDCCCRYYLFIPFNTQVNKRNDKPVIEQACDSWNCPPSSTRIRRTTKRNIQTKNEEISFITVTCYLSVQTQFVIYLKTLVRNIKY